MIPNQRRPDESQRAFRKRRALQHAIDKMSRRRPRLLWNASELGTYRRAIHGEL